MVIVTGTYEMEPDQPREEFLAGRHEGMRTSRGEAGCLEYTLSADPIEPGRLVLLERWADQASLDAHLAAQRSAPRAPDNGPKPTSMTITLYDVTGERPLG